MEKPTNFRFVISSVLPEPESRRSWHPFAGLRFLNFARRSRHQLPKLLGLISIPPHLRLDVSSLEASNSWRSLALATSLANLKAASAFSFANLTARARNLLNPGEIEAEAGVAQTVIVCAMPSMN